MVNKPLIRPYFWGGYVRGGRLTSHERKGLPLHSYSFRVGLEPEKSKPRSLSWSGFLGNMGVPFLNLENLYPIGSMGLVYSPTFA